MIVYIIIFIKGILTRRFVTPLEYGLFIQVQQLLSYGSYMQLGVHNALNFEIPGLIATGKDRKLNDVIGSALGYTLTISGLCLMIIPIVLLLEIENQLKYGYMLTAISLSLSLFMGAVQNIYRGYQNYTKLSNILLLKSIIEVISTLIFASTIGYYGLFLGTILSDFFILIMTLKDLLLIKPIFHLKLFKERMIIGFPIFITGMLWSLIITLSQSIAIIKLNSEEVGYFSIAVMAYSAVMIVPTIISQILYPKILIIRTEEGYKDKLMKYYERIMQIYIPAVCLLTGMLFMTIPYLINLLLPKYELGIVPAQIILLSLFVLAPNSINTNILVALNKTKNIMINIIISIIILMCIELLIIDYFGINGVAISLFIIYIIYFLLNLVNICRELTLDIRIELIRIMKYFIICILPIIVLNKCMHGINALLSSIIFVIVNGTIISLLLLNKKK